MLYINIYNIYENFKVSEEVKSAAFLKESSYSLHYEFQGL